MWRSGERRPGDGPALIALAQAMGPRGAAGQEGSCPAIIGRCGVAEGQGEQEEPVRSETMEALLRESAGASVAERGAAEEMCATAEPTEPGEPTGRPSARERVAARLVRWSGHMRRRPHALPCVIAAAFLVGTLGDWPYGYYMLLRWVTCGAAVAVAVYGHGWRRVGWVWLFGFVALLFNPVVPVHLSRETWQPIDMAAAAAFAVAVFGLSAPRP